MKPSSYKKDFQVSATQRNPKGVRFQLFDLLDQRGRSWSERQSGQGRPLERRGERGHASELTPHPASPTPSQEKDEGPVRLWRLHFRMAWLCFTLVCSEPGRNLPERRPRGRARKSLQENSTVTWRGPLCARGRGDAGSFIGTGRFLFPRLPRCSSS